MIPLITPPKHTQKITQAINGAFHPKKSKEIIPA